MRSSCAALAVASAVAPTADRATAGAGRGTPPPAIARDEKLETALRHIKKTGDADAVAARLALAKAEAQGLQEQGVGGGGGEDEMSAQEAAELEAELGPEAEATPPPDA
eukprot:COSAG04_NODE_1031_length_8627_cov_10.660765_11_plen_109_part_00